MNRLFPLPIYTFLKIAIKKGGIAVKGLPKIPAWLLKTILFEPFRRIEPAADNQMIKKHQGQKRPFFIPGYYRNGTSYLHRVTIKYYNYLNAQ